jgi:hypothetical protein
MSRVYFHTIIINSIHIFEVVILFHLINILFQIADERRERKKTGGGQEGIAASSTAIMVASMVPSQLVSLRNDYDDDSAFLDPNNCREIALVNSNSTTIEGKQYFTKKPDF